MMKIRNIIGLLVLLNTTSVYGGDICYSYSDFKVCRSLAIKGDADAQNTLGNRYKLGIKGAPYNNKTAIKWYKKAAIQGNSDAQYNLGRMYEDGRGVDLSRTQAIQWYTKAAEQGNSDAQNHLAKLYYNEWDYENSAKWYKKAAEEYDSEALRRFVKIYTSGKASIPRYDSSTIALLEKAAEQGNADAQLMLSDSYSKGDRVFKNTREAARWYVKYAEHKPFDADVQLHAGWLYYQNLNYNSAAQWYKKAANNGNVKAQYNLSVMYSNGKLFTNYKTAIYWLEKAVSNSSAYEISSELYQVKKMLLAYKKSPKNDKALSSLKQELRWKNVIQ